MKIARSISIVFFLSIICSLSYAQDATNIGTVRRLEGVADILRNGQEEAAPLNEKDPVYVGDRIRTKSYSKVEVDFIDKSLVRIAPNTCVTIEEYTIDVGNKREHANIKLTRGKVEAIVARTSRPETFEVTTPNAVGKIKGSDIFVFFQAGKTGALVRDGSMSLSNTALPEQEFTLGRGDSSVVPFQDKPLEPRPYLDAELNRHRKDVEPALTKKWIPAEGTAQMTVSITALTGEGARIYKRGAADWRPAKLNETILEGDKLHTAELGTCEVRLSNGNALLLQPNTELAITSLKFDSSTDEFDNTFESSGGKIKAVVAKLGKHSTFQIKTPTAICGARGTIMYLDIQQTSTQAFYEGGGGFMTSTVSDQTQDIAAGQNSTSDVNGNIAPPVITSSDQKVSMDQSFSGQQMMNGYSTAVTGAPTTEGGNIIGPPPTGQTQGSELGQGTNTIIGGVDNPMSDPILPFVTNPNNPGGSLPPPPSGDTFVENRSFAGQFGQVLISEEHAAMAGLLGSISGNFDFNEFSLTTWSGSAEINASGSYDQPVDPDARYLWVSNSNLQGVAGDGGRYEGFLRGNLVNGDMRGLFAAIYIDPSMHAGALTGYFDGTGDGDTFSDSGSYFVSAVERQSVDIPPKDLFTAPTSTTDIFGHGSGEFSGGGAIYCYDESYFVHLNGNTLGLTGKNWGIWFMDWRGVFMELITNSWRVGLGGTTGLVNPGESVWLGTFKGGNTWVDSHIKGDLSGVWLSKRTDDVVVAGVFKDGKVAGDYDILGELNPFEATAAGQWVQLTDELTEAAMGINISENTGGPIVLTSFVAVPIVETSNYTLNIPASTANFNSVTMDTSLYISAPDNRGVWTGIISGSYVVASPPSADWSIELKQNGTTATLGGAGATWANNKWTAPVASADYLFQGANGPANISGQAGGTYSNDGTFEGVGAGVWQEVT